MAIKQTETKRTIRRKKIEWEKKKIEIIVDNYAGNTKNFIEKTNEIKNKFKPRSTVMSGDDGSLITDKTVVASEFKNMSERMLNQPTQNERFEDMTTVEQYLESSTVDEVELAIIMLTNGKAPGKMGL